MTFSSLKISFKIFFIDENPQTELLEDELVEPFKDMSIETEVFKKEESFPCKECGAVYKKPWTLKQHMKKKHEITEELSEFNCNLCDAVFHDQSKLTKHVKIHAKIFVCQECKEVFFEKGDLNKHVKTHLVCKVCSRVCESQFYLNRHIRSHKIY